MSSRLLVADSVSDVHYLAIVVRKFPTHTHAGLLYSDKDGKQWVLELGGPNDLRRNEWSAKFGWVIPSRLKSQELRLVARLCELIWDVQKDNQDIPYGLQFSYDAKFNAANGEFKIGEKLKGLMCATFVLAVFNSLNIQLLDLDSWPPRDEDTQLQQYLAGVFPDSALAAEIPCLRYRPEEVAASCMGTSYPAKFAEIEPLGKKLLEDLTEFLVRSGRATHEQANFS